MDTYIATHMGHTHTKTHSHQHRTLTFPAASPASPRSKSRRQGRCHQYQHQTPHVSRVWHRRRSTVDVPVVHPTRQHGKHHAQTVAPAWWLAHAEFDEVQRRLQVVPLEAVVRVVLQHGHDRVLHGCCVLLCHTLQPDGVPANTRRRNMQPLVTPARLHLIRALANSRGLSKRVVTAAADDVLTELAIDEGLDQRAGVVAQQQRIQQNPCDVLIVAE